VKDNTVTILALVICAISLGISTHVLIKGFRSTAPITAPPDVEAIEKELDNFEVVLEGNPKYDKKKCVEFIAKSLEQPAGQTVSSVSGAGSYYEFCNKSFKVLRRKIK
jgi:hypothetical protein